MPTAQKRVFILDDEVVIASTLAMILRNQGIETMSFSEPMKALEAARIKAPNLVVSDISMPTLSGIDFAIQIQKECPGCKVLLFSGQAGSRDLLETARSGGYDFRVLAKPVYPGELLKRIRGMIDEDSPSANNVQLRIAGTLGSL